MKKDKRAKKGMALVLTAALLVPNGAYAASVSDFSDFPSDWSTAALSEAVDNGLLSGYNGMIRPGGMLTRAEMASVINRAFGASEKASLSGYTDVAKDAWYYDDMAKALEMGTFLGNGDGKLRPDQSITREEAFAVLARAFEVADGDEATLASFSDQASVSDWARGAMAGLIAEGYVGGYDGKLAPKASITRAEFAVVMSKLVDHYVTTGSVVSHNQEGNVVVRAAGATLKDMSIDGDLVIADGVGNGAVTLDNVTVKGRVIARGDVLLKGNYQQVLVAKNGVNVEVAKNAVIKQLQANGDRTTVTGSGQVDRVQADANHVRVDVIGTKVTAGANANGVLAGSQAVKPGATEIVKAPGAHKPDGNVGGSNGNTNGGLNGNTNSGLQDNQGQTTPEVQGNIVVAEKAQIVQTDAGAWLPLVFVDGVNADAVKVFVDGQDVTKSMTKVMSDGSVAKLPLVANPGSVVVQNGKTTQTLSLGSAADAQAIYHGKAYLPDYFMAHGPIPVWDYHLTNYDSNGKPRILPAQTTFGAQKATVAHPAYSPVAVLDKGNNSGMVEIMFNYTSAEDKAWFDGIAESGALALVSHDETKNVLNKALSYDKATVDHHGKTVGVFKVPFNQTNFINNGRYYVRLTDGDGSMQMVPIHVVNHDAPTLKIKETPESGRNLHFEVGNLLYGIADPVEKVTLTKPSGNTVTLDKFDDYFLMSQDLFILYNDVNAANGTNHLDEQGNYTLSIQAKGFQDFGCTFNVGGGAVIVENRAMSASVDAISSATTGGSTGGGESNGGGGIVMTANLLFDGDLLANALVLEKLGQETPAASTILDYWRSNTVSDAVFDKGDNKYFKWSDFISTMNTAQTQNKLWVPFGEYREGATATMTPPNATKAVLEDGLLGQLQDRTLSGKHEAPSAIVSQNEQGKDPVLTFSGKDAETYLSKVKEIQLNGDYRPLDAASYTIDVKAGTITLKGDKLTVGTNSVLVKAEGYKPQTVTVDYQRVTEVNLSITATVSDDKVLVTVKGGQGDFLKNLSGVTLTKDGKETAVLPMGQETADAIYYTVAKDFMSLDLHQVKAGKYTVSLKADGYKSPLTATFTIEAAQPQPEPEVQGQPAPVVSKVEFVNDFMSAMGYYRVAFTTADKELDTYLTTIQSVTANGDTLTKVKYFKENIKGYNTSAAGFYGYQGYLQINANSVLASGKTDIVVKVPGYQDLTITLTDGVYGETVVPGPVQPQPDGGDGQVQGQGDVLPVAKELKLVKSFMGDYYRLSFEKNDDALATYLKAINEVTVDGEKIEKTHSLIGAMDNLYKISTDDATGSTSLIDLTSGCIKTSGTSTIVIKATGYADLTLNLRDGALVR